MIRIAAALTAALLPTAALAQAPGWCASGGLTLTERMICTDAILGRLDRRLAEALVEARRVDPGLDQTAWLAARDACEIGVSCLEEVYRSRIAELASIAASGAPPAIVSTPLPPPADAGLPPPMESIEIGPLAGAEPVAIEPFDETSPSGDEYPDEVALWLEPLPGFDFDGPRPWCGASRLNPSERTICADPDLSRLDAMLETVYGRSTARDDDAAQLRWLRGDRDGCGTSRVCIATTYVRRIEALMR